MARTIALLRPAPGRIIISNLFTTEYEPIALKRNLDRVGYISLYRRLRPGLARSGSVKAKSKR